jgi:hypothetical protein
MMMLRKISVAFMAAFFGVSLTYVANPAKADLDLIVDGTIVNSSPLVWELACPPAACTEFLGQTALIEFSFSKFALDGGGFSDTKLNMHVQVANTGLINLDGDLATLAMQMPTNYISSVDPVEMTSPLQFPSSQWNAGYGVDAVSLNPFGNNFDLCLQTSNNSLSDSNKLKCESGSAVGVSPEETATFDFLINVVDEIDLLATSGAQALVYTDSANTTFTGVDAFRGIFGESIVAAGKDGDPKTQGVCGHFQRIVHPTIQNKPQSFSTSTSGSNSGSGSSASSSNSSSESSASSSNSGSESGTSSSESGGGSSSSFETSDGSDKVCGTLLQTAQVPEPGALPLMLIGMMGLIGIGVQRRRHS